MLRMAVLMCLAAGNLLISMRMLLARRWSKTVWKPPFSVPICVTIIIGTADSNNVAEPLYSGAN